MSRSTLAWTEQFKCPKRQSKNVCIFTEIFGCCFPTWEASNLILVNFTASIMSSKPRVTMRVSNRKYASFQLSPSFCTDTTANLNCYFFFFFFQLAIFLHLVLFTGDSFKFFCYGVENKTLVQNHYVVRCNKAPPQFWHKLSISASQFSSFSRSELCERCWTHTRHHTSETRSDMSFTTEHLCAIVCLIHANKSALHRRNISAFPQSPFGFPRGKNSTQLFATYLFFFKPTSRSFQK